MRSVSRVARVAGAPSKTVFCAVTCGDATLFALSFGPCDTSGSVRVWPMKFGSGCTGIAAAHEACFCPPRLWPEVWHPRRLIFWSRDADRLREERAGRTNRVRWALGGTVAMPRALCRDWQMARYFFMVSVMPNSRASAMRAWPMETSAVVGRCWRKGGRFWRLRSWPAFRARPAASALVAAWVYWAREFSRAMWPRLKEAA